MQQRRSGKKDRDSKNVAFETKMRWFKEDSQEILRELDRRRYFRSASEIRREEEKQRNKKKKKRRKNMKGTPYVDPAEQAFSDLDNLDN